MPKRQHIPIERLPECVAVLLTEEARDWIATERPSSDAVASYVESSLQESGQPLPGPLTRSHGKLLRRCLKRHGLEWVSRRAVREPAPDALASLAQELQLIRSMLLMLIRVAFSPDMGMTRERYRQLAATYVRYITVDLKEKDALDDQP